jgi:23S rRNA pseudouridine1911/1915/1917 synthase
MTEKKHQPVQQRVLFEDNHLIAVNKLPSEIVQGDKTGDMPLSEEVKAFIKAKYEKPGNVFTGVIHRIDRPVSGVTLFAKTGKALTRMNALVKNRGIKKTYWAIVKQKPAEDHARLVHHLLRNEKKNKSFAYPKPVENSKEAILDYRLIAQSNDYFLLEIDLKTGRHHQIRAQLAAIGCPIKGDLKYGFARSNPDASISLHARSMAFMHPVKNEPVFIVADPPDDVLWNFFVKTVKN